MVMQFTPAKRAKVNLSLMLAGPAGSGKTWTALELARYLSEEKIAFIDTEGGSSELYADTFSFDFCKAKDHNPRYLAQGIQDAAKAGYGVVILDSLSHAWEWCLQEVDRKSRNSNSNNKFVAWADVTPLWQELMAIIQAPPCHLIVTARAKMGYELQKDDNGKTKPVKVGLQPIVREQTEYEPQIFATLDNSGGEPVLSIQKTRFAALTNQTYAYPGRELALLLKQWADTGVVTGQAPATFAKASDKTPLEKFEVLQAWLIKQVDSMPEDFEDETADVWTNFCAICKANEQEPDEFFEALFPEAEVTDALLFALSKWLEASPDKLRGHIQNWQRLSTGVITQ